jgi:BirA family biotin operon repressor/biotin-[acetyl-CoA-carboxylase] ligase
LSLAVAVALMRALQSLGLKNAGIKWPNDILVAEHKLAGILVEVGGESNGPCHAVIGIGLNYAMPDSLSDGISQRWTDLRRCGINTGRNRVAGRVLHELLLAIPQYHEEGLEAFRDEWQQLDLMAGKAVRIVHGDDFHDGISHGVDEHGLLLIEDEKGIHHYASGEVSLRAVSR